MSSTDARKFGLGAFALLGAIALLLWLRKHHPAAALAVGGTGALLGVGAFVAPSAVLAVRRGWMAFARLLGRVNGTILLVVIFFVVLTPVGLIRRLFRRTAPPGWEPHEPRPRDHFENPY